MKLPTPKEPVEIKKWMEDVHATLYNAPGINWAPAVVWAGNKLPKYLWDHWKDELKANGFTWQKFMRLMRYRTDNVLLWYGGALSWPKLVGTITEMAEGPLGKELAKKR